MQLKKVFSFFLSFICLIFGSGIFGTASASAANSTSLWTQPINISNSGSSSDPFIFVDADGGLHVIWSDQYAGRQHVFSSDGKNWSQPVKVDFPFRENQPRLFNLPGQILRAFWMTSQGALLTSWVSGADIGNGSAWHSAILFAKQVLGYDVFQDASGVLHLTYLNHIDSQDQPAGVYYCQSDSGGINWAPCQLIYSSLYFRGTSFEQAHTSISVLQKDGKAHVFITWDERPLRKVFLDQSSDGGITWPSPVEIDPTDDTSGSKNPFHLSVSTWNDQVILTWLRSETENICEYLFQVSSNGSSWTDPGKITPDIDQCNITGNLLSVRKDVAVWQFSENDQVYLIGWNGTQWSDPQIQPELSSVVDLSTSRRLTYQTKQLIYQPSNNNLSVVGSDRTGNHDVWFSTMPLGELTDWFPPPAAWKKPQKLVDFSQQAGSINLLPDREGNVHAFWSQSEIDNEGTGIEQNASEVIYYASWNGELWTKPSLIIKPSQGNIKHLSAAIDQNDRLLAAWQNDLEGKLYYSWAKSSDAFQPEEWTDPVALPIQSKYSDSPFILSAVPGKIFIAFSVPWNEDRGVYLLKSNDAGTTWETPKQIFNGQLADWGMVGNPSLAVTNYGRLHAMWAQKSLGNPDSIIGLYSAYSDDFGDTWSNAELVVEGDFQWGRVASLGNDILYHVWQERNSAQFVLKTQSSTDSGKTWGMIETLPESQGSYENPALFFDPAGRLHLVVVIAEENGNEVLHHWQNESGSWSTVDKAEVGQNNILTVKGLQGGVASDGGLVVVYIAAFRASNLSLAQESLYSLNRQISLPADLPQILIKTPVLEKTPTPLETLSATNTPTQMLVFPTEQSRSLQVGPFLLDSTWSGVLLSLGVSGLLLIIGLFIYIMRMRSR
jgi:hypothetical protein